MVDIVPPAFTEAGQPVRVNAMTLDASAYIVRYDFNALGQQSGFWPYF